MEPAGDRVQPGGSADLLRERPDGADVHPGCRRREARYRRDRLEVQRPGERAAHAARPAARNDNAGTQVYSPGLQHGLQRSAGRLDRRAEREDGCSGLDHLRDRGRAPTATRQARSRSRSRSTSTFRARTASSSRRRTAGRARSVGISTHSTRRRASCSGAPGTCRIRPRSRTSCPGATRLRPPRRCGRLVGSGRRSPARERRLRHGQPVPGDRPLAGLEPVDGDHHDGQLEDRRAEVVLPGHPPRQHRPRPSAPADVPAGPDRRQGGAGRRRRQQGRLLLRAEREERRPVPHHKVTETKTPIRAVMASP